MGFLTDMLEKAAGLNCQASNFLKVMSSLSEGQFRIISLGRLFLTRLTIAATLGLLEQNFTNNPLTVTIQAANRFLLRTFVDNFKLRFPQARYMEQALTTGAITAIRCQHCANEMLKPGETLVHDLVYPPKVSILVTTPDKPLTYDRI